MLANDSTAQYTKSPEIADFQPNLFRGLSSILDQGTYFDKESAVNTTNLDLNNAEKTCDLSDYLMQQQKNEQSTTLTQLQPMRPGTPTNFGTSRQEMNLMHTLAYSESSMDSHSSSSNSDKRKLEDEKKTPNKRGRKPASAAGQTGRSKFGKHEHDSMTLVYFGNKKVAVGTQEYDQRRKNNNEAVKKCRERMEKEQKEREKRMKELEDENRKLNDKVSTMNKEMDVLRGIIVSMRPDNKLPENIQSLLNSL